MYNANKHYILYNVINTQTVTNKQTKRYCMDLIEIVWTTKQTDDALYTFQNQSLSCASLCLCICACKPVKGYFIANCLLTCLLCVIIYIVLDYVQFYQCNSGNCSGSLACSPNMLRTLRHEKLRKIITVLFAGTCGVFECVCNAIYSYMQCIFSVANSHGSG